MGSPPSNKLAISVVSCWRRRAPANSSESGKDRHRSIPIVDCARCANNSSRRGHSNACAAFAVVSSIFIRYY